MSSFERGLNRSRRRKKALLLRGHVVSLLCVVAQTSEALSTNAARTTSPYNPKSQPIDGSRWPDRFPAKEHCSRCGLCETSFVSKVSDACAFLGEGMAKIDTGIIEASLEAQVHGRSRSFNDLVWRDGKKDDDAEVSRTVMGEADEARFGVLERPIQLAKGVGIPNAQWTGCVTGIALSMLETNKVDAVVCIAGGDDDGDWSSPEPILARTAEDVLRGRGVKPALAPSLRVLDEIREDPSIQRLLFCGVGCAVQAFRVIERDLGLEEAYVLGTNCADNSPTPQAARDFIEKGVRIGDNNDKDNTVTIRGYEFMQDFRVHVKTTTKNYETGRSKAGYVKKPYFVLPGTIAEASIAPSCLACFDYTNALADVVIGYMGAPVLSSGQTMEQAYQTLTVRNAKGAGMVETAQAGGRLQVYNDSSIALQDKGAHERMASATVNSDSIVQAMVGGTVAESGMPQWLGEIMATVMTTIGPKGIAFARYSIDYHILRNYLHVLDAWKEERTDQVVPRYAKEIITHYMETDDSFRSLVEQVRAKSSPSTTGAEL